MTRGKRPLCQTREVHVEGMKGTVPGSSDERKKSRNGGEQGGRSVEVANATMCKGCQEVLRAGQLLQTLCKEFCQGGLAHESTDEKG